jgi:integrase
MAEKKQFISQNPFCRTEFHKKRPPRAPHIITWDEEEQILRAAPPFLRALVVLMVETGMRSHRDGRRSTSRMGLFKYENPKLVPESEMFR